MQARQHSPRQEQGLHRGFAAERKSGTAVVFSMLALYCCQKGLCPDGYTAWMLVDMTDSSAVSKFA